MISILALLIALMLPSLTSAREQASRVLCGSNLRQFMISMTTYDTVYKAYPPAHMGKSNAFYNFSTTPAYVALRDEFGVVEKILSCPSLKANPVMTRAHGGNYQNNTSEVLYLGYFVVAGYGSRAQLGSPSPNNYNGWLRNQWSARYEGYLPTCGEIAGGGFKAFGSEVSRKQILQPAMQIIAHDMAYTNNTVLDIRWPRQSAHLGNSNVTAAGQNMLYQDGHVTWMNLELGRSWWVQTNVTWTNDPMPATGVPAN